MEGLFTSNLPLWETVMKLINAATPSCMLGYKMHVDETYAKQLVENRRFINVINCRKVYLDLRYFPHIPISKYEQFNGKKYLEKFK